MPPVADSTKLAWVENTRKISWGIRSLTPLAWTQPQIASLPPGAHVFPSTASARRGTYCWDARTSLVAVLLPSGASSPWVTVTPEPDQVDGSSMLFLNLAPRTPLA